MIDKAHVFTQALDFVDGYFAHCLARGVPGIALAGKSVKVIGKEVPK